MDRDSGFMMDVGTSEEGGIKEMMVVGEKLYLIKERALYACILADQIDPNRKNINIPHTVQKIYDAGEDSEIVARTLLQAKFLFEKGLIDNKNNKSLILESIMDLFIDVISLEKILRDLKIDQSAVMPGDLELKKVGASFSMPAVIDINGRVKNFIQRSEHSAQSLFKLCRICFNLPETKNGWFDGFLKVAMEKSQEKVDYLQELERITKFMKFVRNCRHAIEHQTSDKRIISMDFRLDEFSVIHYPSIEVIHPETPEPRISLTSFMAGIIEAILSSGEI